MDGSQTLFWFLCSTKVLIKVFWSKVFSSSFSAWGNFVSWKLFSSEFSTFATELSGWFFPIVVDEDEDEEETCFLPADKSIRFLMTRENNASKTYLTKTMGFLLLACIFFLNVIITFDLFNFVFILKFTASKYWEFNSWTLFINFRRGRKTKTKLSSKNSNWKRTSISFLVVLVVRHCWVCSSKGSRIWIIYWAYGTSLKSNADHLLQTQIIGLLWS